MAIDRNSGTGIAQYGIEREGTPALQPSLTCKSRNK